MGRSGSVGRVYRLGIEELLVPDSIGSLYCVLEQDMYFICCLVLVQPRKIEINFSTLTGTYRAIKFSTLTAWDISSISTNKAAVLQGTSAALTHVYTVLLETICEQHVALTVNV